MILAIENVQEGGYFQSVAAFAFIHRFWGLETFCIPGSVVSEYQLKQRSSVSNLCSYLYRKHHQYRMLSRCDRFPKSITRLFQPLERSISGAFLYILCLTFSGRFYTVGHSVSDRIRRTECSG